MAVVKLNVERFKGDTTFAKGDLYTCSDEEARVLIAEGFASAVQREAATVAPPETATKAAPKARKAAEPKE